MIDSVTFQKCADIGGSHEKFELLFDDLARSSRLALNSIPFGDGGIASTIPEFPDR